MAEWACNPHGTRVEQEDEPKGTCPEADRSSCFWEKVPTAATTPRHPATEKAWAWLDAEEETMALEPMRRARIEEALRLIDATFIAWDEEVGA